MTLSIKLIRHIPIDFASWLFALEKTDAKSPPDDSAASGALAYPILERAEPSLVPVLVLIRAKIIFASVCIITP